MSEELEWELYEMFEGGLFGFPVADHRSARQIVNHLLRRTVLYEEIADAIEESTIDLIIWLDNNGHNFIGEWVMTWINDEREEYFREHGGLDPDDTRSLSQDVNNRHYDNDEHRSLNSQTQSRTLLSVSADNSENGSLIKMMDDRSSASTVETGQTSLSENEESWEDQRKKEYQMMTDMLNVYRKRLQNYDIEDQSNTPLDSNLNGTNYNEQIETDSENNILNDQSDESDTISTASNVQCALNHDAKIKKERMDRIQNDNNTLDKHKVTKKKRSFKEKKHQIQQQTHVTDSKEITLASDSSYHKEMKDKLPTLTYYHKPDSPKCRALPKVSIEACCSNIDTSNNTTSTYVKKERMDIVRQSSSGDEDMFVKNKSNDEETRRQTLQSEPKKDCTDDKYSSGESEYNNNTLSSVDSNSIDRNKKMNIITTEAEIHHSNGWISGLTIPGQTKSACSTLSSEGSYGSIARAPQNMRNLDVDHEVSSFVVRSGKRIQPTKALSDNTYRIGTPPTDLKEYSRNPSLTGFHVKHTGRHKSEFMRGRTKRRPAGNKSRGDMSCGACSQCGAAFKKSSKLKDDEEDEMTYAEFSFTLCEHCKYSTGDNEASL